MFGHIVGLVNRIIRPVGFQLKKVSDPFVDINEQLKATFRELEPYTMTSVERRYALRQAVEYIVRANVPGDIVECGVWKGGSMMLVARTLLEMNAERHLWLYDTFEGMSEPTTLDVDRFGRSATDRLPNESRDSSWLWAYSPLEQVKCNMESTGYPDPNISYIKGKVEDTIPNDAPDSISLLRLDTDWHESTLHELRHLYPRISVGGVLIIDDYGDWSGARKAVDEYFASEPVLLHRIDHTGRMVVKMQSNSPHRVL